MPLFTAGYSYSKVMDWGKQLERNGEIFYSEEGVRNLTEKGERKWKVLKKRKHNFSILPLEGCRTVKLNIDDIYLP